MTKLVRTKRTQRRRRYKPRRKYANPRQQVVLSGFPRMKVARLRYVSEKTLNPTTSGFDYHTFRANCVYDPDAAAGGHSPTGFDQWMTTYNHFTVLGSKIYLQPYALSTGTVGFLSCALTSDSTVAFTTTTDLLQSRLVGYKKMLGGNNNVLPTMPGMHKTFSAKKFFKITSFIGKDLYRGSASSSPTEQAYYHVIYSSPSGADAGAQSVLVTIDYIVAFTEPKELNSS